MFARGRFESRWAAPAAASCLLLSIALVAEASEPFSNGAVVDFPIGANPTTVIDTIVEQSWQVAAVEPSPPCDDVAFLRRVYLDLAGRIPTSAETHAFQADDNDTKRVALVDWLLDSDDYARHMRDVFDVVLMGRVQTGRRRERAQKQRRESGWLDYLEVVFRENRPWNQIVREVVLARPAGDANRGAVQFLYERNDKHQDIAEAVSASLFGVQIQCAQCHDHLTAFEIEQRHYWGLVAFFNRGKNVETDHGPRVAESAVGGFAKFTNLSGDASDALLTFLGTDQTVEETRPDGDEKPEDTDELYVTHDDSGTPLETRVPKFSRRQAFVDEIVSGNPLIARAFVNRVWALLMGRGIVHPVDKMDSMHDPSHPELLDWLAADFERSGYDVKRLVRAIVLSRAYQLDGRPASSAADESTFAWALQKPLSAEVLYRSMLIAVDGSLDHEDAATMEAFREVFPDVFVEEKVSDLKQSLFLSNNEVVQRVCELRPQGTLEQKLANGDLDERARIAYEAAFQRQPESEELSACRQFLDRRRERPEEAVRQLMWALLTSAEFRFNH
jgi:hypothetical protein